MYYLLDVLKGAFAMRKLLGVLLSATMIAMLLTGCNNSSTNTGSVPAPSSEKVSESSKDISTLDNGEYSGVKVACLVKTQDNVYWSDMGKSIEEWAKKNNATVDMYYADSEKNIQGQLEKFENLIGMGYNAICFAPLTSQNLTAGIVKATQAGIVCVNIDESMDFEAARAAGGVVYSNFVTDNKLVGEKAAKYISEKLGENCEVGIVEGAAGNTTSQQRTAGAKDGFKKAGLKLVASQPGNWDRMVSMDVTTNMITSNPNIKAIFACNDVEALGVTEGVKNAGKLGKIMVVGTDATADGKASIAKGEMTASIGQANLEIGIKSVQSAIKACKSKFVPSDHIGDKSYPKITYINSFLVDKSNISKYQ